MENTSFIALSRQAVLRRQMNVIANNIANMNTTGFKGEKMMFVEHLVPGGGESTPGGTLSFVRDVATVRDLTEGHLVTTNGPLDVALRGDGYFVVSTEQGERYTRNGRFHLDEAGRLVTQHGHPVLSRQGQPITIAATDRKIDITAEGTVATENGPVGQLRVVRFNEPQAMRQISGGLLSSEEMPEDVAQPRVAQNMLESSNVEPIIEMTRMIEVNRAYQNVTKMITAEDERLKKMITTLAAPAQG